jgi:hypothetical protein
LFEGYSGGAGYCTDVIGEEEGATEVIGLDEAATAIVGDG